MRTCRKCGERKSLENFEIYNKVREWRRHSCRECRSRYWAEWASKSKESVRKYARSYYLDNRDKILKKVSKWVKDNPDRRRINALSYYYRLQHQAIEAYGGYKCSCCGESEPLFLTLDHVNNDGNKHREKMGTSGGHKFYKWLRNNNYPEGFQVLCSNCNHGKHRNNGICPHKLKEGATTIPKGSRTK